jgi:stress-induced morphogen
MSGVSAPAAVIEQRLQAAPPTAAGCRSSMTATCMPATPAPREGSHFRVTIVSERFTGLARVARHRLVYDALRSLIPQGMHALAIEARSPRALSVNLIRRPDSPMPPPAPAGPALETGAPPAPLKAPPMIRKTTRRRRCRRRCRHLPAAPLAARRRTSPSSTARPCPRRVSTLLLQQASACRPADHARDAEQAPRRGGAARDLCAEAEKRGIAASRPTTRRRWNWRARAS